MRELDLLQHIYESAMPPSPGIPIPPGDDMAMVEVNGRMMLAGVDQVVSGRHFDLATTPIELIGRKSVTRSLSDVAAMAAQPVAALAAATLPPELGQARAVALFDAMRATAQRYGCPLIGGDVAIGPAGAPMICTVTVLAEPGPAGAVRRSGARPGDGVYVTGALGGSLEADGTGKHLTFEPRLAAALALARALGPSLHAMIDLSDGLGIDAARIADRSGVRIALDADRIPCAAGIGWQRAMADGEDYELCFVAAGDVPDGIDSVAITAVGRVLEPDPAAPLVQVHDQGRTLDCSNLGWEHRS